MATKQRARAIIGVATVLAFASTTGYAQQSSYSQRSQTFLMSQSEAHSKGVEAFASIKATAASRGALVTDGELYNRVDAVTKRLLKVVPEMRSDADSWGWDFILVRDSTPNAFALPGGKMVIQTGLVDNLDLTDDEMAAVIGHELSHALREHSREKAEQKAIANAAVGILMIVAAAYGARKHVPNTGNVVNATGALGSMGAAAFFLLPNSREMELEADRMGVDLSAMAGYNPQAAASVWEKMSARGTGGDGGFLSTHPSHATRISEVTAQASVASQKFADRRVVSSTIIAAKPRPVITDSVACVLPSGSAEALAPLACMRVGGTLKSVDKQTETTNTGGQP